MYSSYISLVLRWDAGFNLNYSLSEIHFNEKMVEQLTHIYHAENTRAWPHLVCYAVPRRHIMFINLFLLCYIGSCACIISQKLKTAKDTQTRHRKDCSLKAWNALSVFLAAGSGVCELTNRRGHGGGSLKVTGAKRKSVSDKGGIYNHSIFF